MKNPLNVWPMLAALAIAFSLAGCAAGGAQQGTQNHLSATECADLTAVKHDAPATHKLNLSELSALEKAGYRPALGFDPYYPQDLQDAQRKVDAWYQAECPQAKQSQ
ncbi:DUF4148 domain-containing protein [Paraburkholderia rhizosphaerae]|uniref:Uncharacterized protein DUF4148 n=1 Tax=Paraburkholderia rhizosphaerae TaxID=480658 RepID=A0A4R8LZF0_9BURK|nr:DUF4148 domain-containing protein [Paraburkholderia rhizosphaerae]TDY52241.1 uncharacterized protein DUF4148 [Paraburkholderia rhizosphaerae]